MQIGENDWGDDGDYNEENPDERDLICGNWAGYDDEIDDRFSIPERVVLLHDWVVEEMHWMGWGD